MKNIITSNMFKSIAVTGLFILALSKVPDFKIPFLSPLPEKLSVMDTLIPKLKARDSDYRIRKERSIIPQVQAEGKTPDVHAYAVIDYDTGNVITESNMSTSMPIASLTKIMTAVVALDLASPDELFTVSQHAADMIPTKIGVVPGQKLTLRELLKASLMTSANDATQVIAEGIDAKYGANVFIDSMNEKAKFLKLKKSHFANAQGLDDPNNYSTAEELAILTHYALQYPLIADIVKKDTDKLPADGNHKVYDTPNWNGLIGVYPGTFGMKIGNTGDALYTTVVVSERAGRRIMTVLLGAKNTLQRDLEAANLLDLGFEMSMNLKPVGVTEADLRAKYASWVY
jgi:serine-type D-Ala-D-Ala carboxypeptidase (penicillin-binding protein 5/6)